MEKKTIGGFLAALRKANGMTQKDLAEKLNVSDKTVSRWERDDGAPDLALIPVLAELFGVTCDELLRGERKSPEERAQPEEAAPSPKGEKQRQRLLSAALHQYQNASYLSMGLAALGLLAALICNFAFLRASLGFFLGAAFYTASLLSQAIFRNRAFFKVEDGGLEEEALAAYQRKVTALFERSIGLTVALLGFTSPLLLASAYTGLGDTAFLLLGAIGAGLFLLVYAIVLYFLHGVQVKQGRAGLSEQETARYQANHRRKGRCALVLAILLAVTAVGHLLATTIWGPFTIMEGTTFEDYDSFIAYMEQDIPAKPLPGQAPAWETVGDPTYYDEFGREITEEEAMTRTLEDAQGNVVCTYRKRNERVISIQYAERGGSLLPITVYTQENLEAAQAKLPIRHLVFAALYALECLAVILVYWKKRAK